MAGATSGGTTCAGAARYRDLLGCAIPVCDRAPDAKALPAMDPATMDPRPSGRLAVVTCMDARIDALAVLGLRLGAAHVLRNGGGRVTDDVLRGLALSANVFGVETVVLMQHTGCGLVGVTDEELRERTGADIGFLPIADHAEALRQDVQILAGTPFLTPITAVEGSVYDIATGKVEQVVRWDRP